MSFLSESFCKRSTRLILVLCLCALIQPLMACAGVSADNDGGSTSVSASGDVTSAQDDAGAASDSTTSDSSSDSSKPCDVSAVKICLKDFLSDQAGIWTSPLRLRPHDALWALPLGAAIGVALEYDVRTLQEVSTSPSRIRFSNDFSDAGAYGAAGVAGATYILGKVTHNETVRETGVLSLEAIADAGVVAEVLKLATNRERPYMGTGTGRFWPDGTNVYTADGSFPSGHATVIWAFSRVVADETPGHRWLHLGLYAIATGVSVARVTSRNHFPSDVVVGAAIGYLTGGYVYGQQHSNSYDNDPSRTAFTVSPVYDAPTRSFGIGVTVDPGALRSANLNRLWLKSLAASAR